MAGGAIRWHVYPEQASPTTTPADLAKFVIEVQLSLLGKSNRVLKQSTMQEMVTPVGVGPFAVGFTVEKQGEGWYFMHGGSNWGFQCDVIGHRSSGYGLAIMTNGDNGFPLIQELRTRIERAYDWDVFASRSRTYGPPPARSSDRRRRPTAFFRDLFSRLLFGSRRRESRPGRSSRGGAS
jgi:hypothetical protein